MENTKIEDLINTLDPIKIQCTECNGWFNNDIGYRLHKICLSCYFKLKEKQLERSLRICEC